MELWPLQLGRLNVMVRATEMEEDIVLHKVVEGVAV